MEPASLPKIPKAWRKAVAKKAAPPGSRNPPADRSKLDAAQMALRALDEGRKREEAHLHRQQDELQARLETVQDDYVEAKKAAKAKVADARAAYPKAGGG